MPESSFNHNPNDPISSPTSPDIDVAVRFGESAQDPEDHLDEVRATRYLAALIASQADTDVWRSVTEHLAACRACRDLALHHVERVLEDSADLLEPGARARHAQRLWIDRLQHHAHPAMRQAAARQLRDITPLEPQTLVALLDASMQDDDYDVRAAAMQAFRMKVQPHARRLVV